MTGGEEEQDEHQAAEGSIARPSPLGGRGGGKRGRGSDLGRGTQPARYSPPSR